MYRLLIVDNEEIIVNHLYEIFRGFDHLDLDVYKAYGGEEAIEWLNRTRIDIVLTDIDMPHIDGLQLMEEIFRSWPQCRVIFLTGHSEFRYVYKAIQYQDVSYILKTENIDKVIQVVEETVSKIRQEIKTEDLIREAKEQINIALNLFQEDYLLGMLKGSRGLQASQSQFEELSIPLNVKWPVALVVGKIDKFPDSTGYMQKMQQIYAVRQIMHRYLATRVNFVIVLDDSRRFVIFIQPKESLSATGIENAETILQTFNKTVSFLKGILEVIQSACQENIGIPISFTIGSQADGWETVSNKYHSLHHLLNYRIGLENTVLLIDDVVSHDEPDEAGNVQGLKEEDLEGERLARVLKSNDLSLIEQYLEAGQRSKYFEALELLLAPIRDVRTKNNAFAQEIYYTVSLYLMSYINRWALNEKIEAQVGQNRLMRIDFFDSWSEASLYLTELSSVLFDMQKVEQKKRADHIIDFLQEFIRNHLDEDLSLVRLAEQVYLNPSYLSRIYKQETGNNLTEFIESSRLMQAKRLLHSENLRIGEVARRVGYETASSFTRFFKKATGCSPQEYKEKQLIQKP